MREHGTPNGYGQHRYHGERACDPCRLAHNARIRELRHRIQDQGLPADDPRHGTFHAYSSLGCRCEPCRRAGRDFRAGARSDPAYRPLKHGTEYAYRRHGCRCPTCREGWRKIVERRRSKLTEEDRQRARAYARDAARARNAALTPEQRKEKNRQDWARRRARESDEQRAAKAAYLRERRRKRREES